MPIFFSLLGMAVFFTNHIISIPLFILSPSLSLPSRAMNTMEVILYGGCLALICYYTVLVFSGMVWLDDNRGGGIRGIG